MAPDEAYYHFLIPKDFNERLHPLFGLRLVQIIEMIYLYFLHPWAVFF